MRNSKPIYSKVTLHELDFDEGKVFQMNEYIFLWKINFLVPWKKGQWCKGNIYEHEVKFPTKQLGVDSSNKLMVVKVLES